jgi:hypothetical protein
MVFEIRQNQSFHKKSAVIEYLMGIFSNISLPSTYHQTCKYESFWFPLDAKV